MEEVEKRLRTELEGVRFASQQKDDTVAFLTREIASA
jgi:hypothetical protein